MVCLHLYPMWSTSFPHPHIISFVLRLDVKKTDKPTFGVPLKKTRTAREEVGFWFRMHLGSVLVLVLVTHRFVVAPLHIFLPRICVVSE